MSNSRCRHVLVQAAWSYRKPPRRSLVQKRRQAGQPVEVVAHTWKAQQRFYKLFHRSAARKAPQIAAVDVARELIGFLWAGVQGVEPSPSTEQQGA